MSGQTWHDGGRPLGPPLLISVLLHGLCLALVGLVFTPQGKMPLRPEPIKIGLIFKPAAPPVPRTVKTSVTVPPEPRPQRSVKETIRPEPVPPPTTPAPVMAEPKPRARAIRKRALAESKMRPPEPDLRQPQLTVPPVKPEPVAKYPEAVNYPTTGTRNMQAPVTAQPAQPVQQHDSTAYQIYLSKVRQQIDRAKRYPLMARRGGQQGSVLIAFSIAANGRLDSSKILHSSGFKQLDRAALKAVRSAAPFASLPEDAGAKLALQLPVRFELRR